MTRVVRPLFVLALAALAFAAHAEPVHLIAPANGATLRGGSFAEITWTASRLPAKSEEWEAFLSVDGGKYYAVRITPHLDIDVRRFTFVVPNVDTHNARILIRTGDEEQETHFESDALFTIVRDANAQESVSRVVPTGRGEAARDGDAPVVSWIDGDRHGSGLQQRVGLDETSHSIDLPVSEDRDSSPALAAPAHFVSTPSLNGTVSARPTRASRARSISISTDLLLVCRRLNV
jgi:hypothetical protein